MSCEKDKENHQIHWKPFPKIGNWLFPRNVFFFFFHFLNRLLIFWKLKICGIMAAPNILKQPNCFHNYSLKYPLEQQVHLSCEVIKMRMGKAAMCVFAHMWFLIWPCHLFPHAVPVCIQMWLSQTNLIFWTVIEILETCHPFWCTFQRSCEHVIYTSTSMGKKDEHSREWVGMGERGEKESCAAHASKRLQGEGRSVVVMSFEFFCFKKKKLCFKVFWFVSYWGSIIIINLLVTFCSCI